MKKKYLVIVLSFLMTACCAIGAALWIILSDNSAIPTSYTKKNLTTATVSVANTTPIYYGETIELDGTAKFGEQTVTGTWEIDDDELREASVVLDETDNTYKAKVSATFTPTATGNDDKLFNSADVSDVSIPIYPVAYTTTTAGSTSGTYYTTIEGAITAANNGDEKHVYVCESYDNYKGKRTTGGLTGYKSLSALTIQKNCMIGKDTTLYIPSNGTTIKTATGGSTTIKEAYANPEIYFKYNVSIAKNITLTNNGTIQVGGVISGGGGGYKPNSLTAGNYGQITMYDNTKLVNQSIVNCYGFIDEYRAIDDENYDGAVGNGSQVINNNGSSLTAPFTVVEHRGGSVFLGVYRNMQGAAFNRFYMSNVTSKVIVNYGAALLGYVNLWANDKPNETIIKIAGKGNSNLINIKNGSKIIAKYNPNNMVTKLDTYGNLELNSMSLSLAVDIPLINQTVADLSTENVLFPISWYYNVALNPYENEKKAKVVFNQNIKILPGGSLTVAKGIILEVDQIAVYDGTFTDPYNNENLQYESGKSNAELIINGTLRCNTLGGIVSSSETEAILSVTSNSIETSELVSGNQSSSTWETNTYPLKLDTAGEGTAEKADAGIYQSDVSSSGKIYWKNAENETFNIQYSYVYDNFNGEDSKIINPNKSEFKCTDANFNLETPTYSDTDVKFVGWYTDSDCREEITTFENALFAGGSILYGKWTTSDIYTFQFVTNNDNISIPQMKVTGNELDSIMDDEEIYNQITSYDDDLTSPVYFDGWYFDGSFAIPYAGNLVPNYVDNSMVEIFSKWIKKKSIEIEAVSKDTDGDTVNPNWTLQIRDTEENAFETVTYSGVEKKTYWVPKGYFVFIVDNKKDDKETFASIKGIDKEVWTPVGDNGIQIKIEYYKNHCIAAGTLITLADGSQKKVEDLLETDKLLVFDHETGKYVAADILFIERDGWKTYDIINLEFSNGQKTRLIYEHGLFDLTLNKYVYINESNYAQFVGHEFAIIGKNDTTEKITLNKAYMTTEYTGCYSLVTAYHLNYFIDGLFSMPGGIDGLFNIFEYDEDLKYDEEKMKADIEKYGLYTYEDFAAYLPYEVYAAFPAPYFKVAVGKGLVTFEEILGYIETYLVRNGII